MTEDERRSLKEQAIAEHTQAEQDLRQSSREMFGLARDHLVSRGVVPLAARDIVAQLGPREAMLIYDIGFQDSILWLAQGGMGPEEGIASYALSWPDGTAVTTPSLTARIRELLEAIELRASASAHVLPLRAALLPDRIRAVLGEAHLTVVVPDGPLHGLPFEMLDNASTENDTGPAVVYAPSATVFINRRQRSPANRHDGRAAAARRKRRPQVRTARNRRPDDFVGQTLAPR